MHKKRAIGIFDIGKTNKKFFLFDSAYNIVYERQKNLPETEDEDGFPCEDVEALTSFLYESLDDASAHAEYTIEALNFSAYGASWVLTDEKLHPVAPLYNYLKPLDENLSKAFYAKYGGSEKIALETSSPTLACLNSGMSLYAIKKQKRQFADMHFALHLPQFLSAAFSKRAFSDLTSIGCHTQLWNFAKNNYHQWVFDEGLSQKLAPIVDADHIENCEWQGLNLKIGVGLHDSSSALIPYLKGIKKPFVLISTGTWCISLNPFNNAPIAADELKKDCLNFLSFEGKPVKASRLFAGHFHEEETKRLADHFKKPLDYYKKIEFNNELDWMLPEVNLGEFEPLNLSQYATYPLAYQALMAQIVAQQIVSTKLVLQEKETPLLFVDGGFSQNPIFMHLLSKAFPEAKVYAALVPQASALGAALILHQFWNPNSLPENLISFKLFESNPKD
ncbi:carbohydrate kinase [Marinilongibacter aquaticus]|uniref:FGGY-family carbohydrate kinase n=1 Tax=Marinilongibacter aquaticus TaxID=2975157 RepID=UPI0021BD7222|nr:carbohydrate kinase [Marinilongibacter aquaticus]UBM59020.1 carbohydrate kinase [Marinilongibacter aquaticus]